MKIVPISSENLIPLSQLMVALWPDTRQEEELINCTRILKSKKETCYLVKTGEAYVGFIYVSMRYDYVEGTSSSPVAYIEGIYIDEDFRVKGLGAKLVNVGEAWGKMNGCTEIASDVELHNVNSLLFHEKIGFQEANRVVCFAKKIS